MRKRRTMMKETEYNLLDEPWIRVMDKDCHVYEVSLRDAIINAHKYSSLAGELPTQDIVILRLMLAILHTVFSRVDSGGNECFFEDEEEALEQWKALWDHGRIPEKPVNDYLNKWHERFWLFHPDRPFGQVASLTYGTQYTASKLNGELSESGNKLRLFSAYSGSEKNSLSYSQAARWLLYLNAFDDTSAKPSKEGKEKSGNKLPSPGTGWLGKLGLVYINGKNLFETLLLNLILINENRTENMARPVWEKDKVEDAERSEISIPDNLAELYTLQSRRLLLHREDDRVTGYTLLGGDFFEKENAFYEPMTLWRVPKKAKDPYMPKRHDPEKKLWREFTSLLEADEVGHASGIIRWYHNYISKIMPRPMLLQTVVVSVQYGDKDFFVRHVFSDSLSMNGQLLSEIGRSWRADIQNEIERCEKLANAAGVLSREIYSASGGSITDWDKATSSARGEMYFRFDIPFRNWLSSIEPDDMEGKQSKLEEWQNIAKQLALGYANELTLASSEVAIIGHKIDGKIYSVPKAVSRFRAAINAIYRKI